MYLYTCNVQCTCRFKYVEWYRRLFSLYLFYVDTERPNYHTISLHRTAETAEIRLCGMDFL